MPEVSRLADQLRRSCFGEAWHGHSLQDILDGITAEQAQLRIAPQTHNIWELVLHVTCWNQLAASALNGTPLPKGPDSLTWPPVDDTSNAAWQKTLERLEEAVVALKEAVERLDDGHLEETVPGRAYRTYCLLSGVTQHNLYHAGQMALIKKALFS
jgi:uncharacterized damage-inducible protein DinB